jgi:hypothetical protein
MWRSTDRNGWTDGQADRQTYRYRYIQSVRQIEDQYEHTLPNRTNTQFDFSPAIVNV